MPESSTVDAFEDSVGEAEVEGVPVDTVDDSIRRAKEIKLVSKILPPLRHALREKTRDGTHGHLHFGHNCELWSSITIKM